MRVCRFARENRVSFGLLRGENEVLDLSSSGITSLGQLLDRDDLTEFLSQLGKEGGSSLPLNSLKLLAPVDQQEVWAAGVTYLRSKTARMEESDFSASAYDRVYEAERPELFFKSMPEKVSGLGGPIGIRRDARWSVPEPELALAFNSRGELAGYTIGNDMSSRDIEGENLLYLPQGKIYRHSCALGPWIQVGVKEKEARSWVIHLEIRRQEQIVFKGETSVEKIKRSFTELGEFLFRCQQFPHGVFLLTGTGVVPPDDFTLSAGDRVRIGISGIGELENRVEVV